MSGTSLRTAGIGWHQFVADMVAGDHFSSHEAGLPGAGSQRCRRHYARNLLAVVPRSAQPWVATLLRTIFDYPDAEQVRAQYERVVDALAAKFPAAAGHLDAARADLPAWRVSW